MNDNNGNMTDREILKRYTQANLSAIVAHDRTVFASLMDIPRLVKERTALLTKLREQETMIEELKKNEET